MYYSIISAQSFKRTLAVLAIFALVFGPLSHAFAQTAPEDTPQVCAEGTTGNFPDCTPIPLPEPVVDVCSNIPEVQTATPEGYTNNDGICTLIDEVVDMCKNIDGVQATVPEGDEVEDGSCFPKSNEVKPQECIGSNLLTNGSFEDPVVSSDWSILPSVTGWNISSDGLELWHNFMGGASQGDQNAELDGNQPTTISQPVSLVPGNEYQVSFDFSPRINTDATDNKVDVAFDGSVLGTVSADGTTNTVNNWTSHYFNVTAATTSALFELRDKGVANSLGSLVDNAVVCLVKDNVKQTHKIDGYKFNDENHNGIWDEGEHGIPNWTITLTNENDETSTTTSVTTDENGYYSFNVEDGSYNVHEVQQEGWEQTATIGDHADGNTCYYSFGGEQKAVKFDSENENRCNFGNHEVSVAQCTETGNLLANGSFETPVINNAQGWDVFDSVVNGLTWAVSWINPGVNSPAVAKLELQNGRPASAGSQYAELDSNFTHPGEVQILGDARVKIAQTVTTVPGAVYTLTYDFSAIPGHGHAVNNVVQVVINGAVVDTQTTSLPVHATTTNWTHQSFTFTATGTSTEVALADAGKSNTFGTLIDNVSLTGCVVPPVDMCPNIEGTQTSVPQGDVVNSDGQCVPTTVPQVCSVNVVSDVTNTVTENESANAVLTWVHPNWLASIASSTAAWIWGSVDEQNPTQTETETFVKKFTWNGPATTAVLKIATDNSYVVKLNGVQVAADPALDNFAAADTVDVVANIITGENTLEIAVTNAGVEGAGAHDNPAGLLYDLTVVGNTETDCTKVTDGGSGGHDTYKLFGTVWNDTDKDNIVDEGEADLSDWTVRAVNASNSEQVFTTESDVNGHYELNVPAGTWIVSELTPDGWVLLSSGDGVNGTGTYTVTVPAPEVMTLMNWIIPTAEAASLGSFGPYNFGNNATDTTTITTSSRHHHGGSSTPTGQVLGDSTTKPAPTGEVLGASTSTMPVGAPNTGAGGTSASPMSASSYTVILASRVSTRKTK